MWEGLEVDEVIDIVVGMVGGRVAVEIGRLHHVCVGQAEEVGVVGFWARRGLAVELTAKLSNGWMEKEQWVCVCLRPAGKLPLMVHACTETLFP